MKKWVLTKGSYRWERLLGTVLLGVFSKRPTEKELKLACGEEHPKLIKKLFDTGFAQKANSPYRLEEIPYFEVGK